MRFCSLDRAIAVVDLTRVSIRRSSLKTLTEAPLQEKRSHPRVAIGLGISCEVKDGPVITGRAKDISLGGMFIEATEVPEFGTAVTVVARLPGIPADARLPAVVRWRSAGGFGVQFGLLGARDTHAITRLMKGG